MILTKRYKVIFFVMFITINCIVANLSKSEARAPVTVTSASTTTPSTNSTTITNPSFNPNNVNPTTITNPSFNPNHVNPTVSNTSQTTISPLKAGGGFTISNSTNINCFYDTVGNMVTRLQVSVNRFSVLCSVNTIPKFSRLIAATNIIGKIEGYKNTNYSLIPKDISDEVMTLDQYSDFKFSSYLTQIKAGFGLKADISEIIKNLWLALGDDIDFIIKNNNYPFYFRGNMWSLIQSTRSLNILKTIYAGKYNECLPNTWSDITSISDLSSDQNFMTVFRRNNKGKCKSDATDITIHPNSFTNGGVAITFWGSENIAELGGKQGSPFVGYINNNIVYEYTLVPEKNIIVHQIKKTFSISPNSSCASYFFVVISIQKDCEKYKLIFSIRFLVSNTRKTAEFEVSADQVENLHLIFDKTLTFSNNMYKNFKYLPENEILLVSYSLDTGIFGKLLKRATCAPNCDYSVGETNCVCCRPPMKNFDGKCLPVCPDSYYSDKDGICKPCAAPCSKCEDSLNGNCKECKEPYFFYNGKCDIRCPDTTASDTQRQCFSCGQNCVECKDLLTCGKCDATSFLKAGKCVQDCGNKFFKSWTPTTCKPCNNGCETCESTDKCNTCSTGYFLLGNTCVPNCGSGYWGDKDTNSCKKCNLNCEFCKDSITCLKCFSGFLLNQGNCIQKCPLKTAEVRGVCVPCTNKECEVCNADQVSECKVCSKDFYLKNYDCVDKCGDFYYADENKNCQKCSTDCKVCSKDKCLECIPTKFVLRDIECTKECPDNYIELGKSCIKCTEPTCKKCMDTSLGSCSLCFENSINKALLAGKCLTECPIKYFLKNNKNCEPCLLGCDKCQNNFNCQTCSPNYFMQNNLCVTKCDSGYAALNKTDCSPCLVKSCSICSGDKLQTCDKCNDKLFLFNNQCIEKCPLGTFSNEKMSCEPCPNDCAECENKYKCTKCNLGKSLQETTCVSLCNDGYIPINGVCTKCTNKNCKRCSPIDLTVCTECPLEKFLHKGECKPSCPDGTYPLNSQCLDCVLPCQNCTTANKCTSCIKGFNLNGDICGDSCPDKTVAINSVCTKCFDLNCKKCNNNLSQQCISCDKDFVLYDGNCQKICPDKFYDENGVCKPCLVGCNKSKNGNSCDACVIGKFLKDGNQCVTECGDGYIENQAICKKCVATCKKCKVEDSSSCSACYSKYFLYKSECLSICPEQTYDTEDFTCVDCPTNHCRTCKGGKTCSECSTGYVLEDNVCHTPPCSEGWVLKAKLNECAKCEVNNCISCPNTNLKICDKCKNNYFLIGDNKCEKDCISGTFKNTITGKCQNCSSNCSTCANDKICSVCNINFYLFDNHCVEQCETGYSKTDGKCLPCAVEGCGVCSNNKICELCKSPLVLNEVKCEVTCPKGSFNSLGICKKCSIFCDECKNLLNCDVCQKGKVLSADNKCIDECPSGSIVIKDKCTQCTGDLKCNKCDPLNLNNCLDCINGLVLKDNICKTECGDYNYTENRKCFNCAEKCLKCSNKNTCTHCDKGFYLYQNSCIFPCPKGFRAQDGKCIACSEDCESCDTKTCITCASKTLLEEGKCVKVCSNGFYTTNQIDCRPCGESCLKCFTENSCTICNAATFIKDGKCVTNCGLGYIAANGKCVKCQNYCNVCNKENPLECTDCIVGKPLYNGVCYDICPVKHYMEDNKCFKCGDSCDKCDNNKSCNTCTPPYYLSDKKICVLECPDTYNGIAGLCKPCVVNECQTCKSSINVCDACKGILVLSEGKCEPNCPVSGYYKSSDGRKCSKCLAPCNNCKSETSCIDCQNGYVLQNEKCVNKCNDGYVKTVGGVCKQCETKDCQICEEDLKTCQLCSTGLVLDVDSKGIFICLTLCPVGKYNDKGKCKNCSENCDKCTDSLQCNLCSVNYVLQNGKCQKKCDKYNVERNLQCFKCNDSKCVSCDAMTLKGCNICDENYYLKNGECKPDCGNSFYKFTISVGNNVCKACKDNCQTCANESTCEMCLPGFLLKGNDCVSKCEEGFVIKDNKYCLQCTSKYCQICDSNNVDKCITCINGYYLKNNQCVKECGENYFTSDRGLCLPCLENCFTCSPQNYCLSCSKNKVIVDGICKDSCPIGYVPDPKNNNVCVSCKDKNCELCNPSSLDKCIQCKKGFLLGPDFTCDSKCPQKYYSYKDVSCATCAKNCDNCVSDTNCNICAKYPNSTSTNSTNSNSTYILNQNKMCVDNCDDGAVNVNGNCKNCTSPLCSRCQANDLTQCIVCKVGSFIYGSICQTKCPDNTYISGTSICVDCDKKCSKCASSTECLSCNIPYVLQDKTCIENCYDGYSNKNGTCVKCNNFEKTKTCDNNIITCRNNYFLDDKICVDFCPDGKFPDLSKICNNCAIDCAKCTSLAECKLCKATAFMYRGVCQPRCPAKTINILGVCTDCKNTKCFECQPTDLNKCTKCDNSSLFEDDCFTACPSGTFKYGDICQKCDIKCASCKNATTCDICKEPFYLSNSQCITDCPIGTAKRDKNCLACADKNCGICNSNDLSVCTSCRNGFLLGTLCIDNCPITYRSDNTKKTCEKCSNFCDICDEKGCIQCTNNFYFSESDPNFCMSCEDPSMVKVLKRCEKCKVDGCKKCEDGNPRKCKICDSKKILFNGECKDTCPERYYKLEQSCLPCVPGCLSCTNDKLCDLCEQGFEYNGLCKPSCPINTVSDPVKKKCYQCAQSLCDLCDLLNVAICRVCAKNSYLYKNSCYSICPTGTYTSDLYCIDCPDGCTSCNKNQCVGCTDKKRLKGTQCVDNCGDGYFQTAVNCEKCTDNNCKTCSPANTCQLCNDNSYLMENEHNCVITCSNGYFADKNSKLCVKCDEGCSLCTGSKNCLTCEKGFNMYKGICVKVCPDGFSPVSNVCQPCQIGCSKCSNNPLICEECTSPSVLYNNICITSCPTATFVKDSKCIDCDKKCNKCKDEFQCEECKPEFRLSDGKCLEKCSDGKVEVNGRCMPCGDSNCKSCLSDTNICVECLNAFYLYDNSCRTKCPNGTFVDKGKECKSCLEGCDQCTDTITCDKCTHNFFLFNKKCVKECPIGLYGDCVANVCYNCMEACQDCADGTVINCPKCAKGYFKNENVCVQAINCRKGTYANEESRTCLACRIPYCAECLDRTTCKVCIKGFELKFGACIQSKTFLSVLSQSPNLFSSNTLRLYKTIERKSFNIDLKGTGIGSDNLTFNFWLRRITDIPVTTRIFETESLGASMKVRFEIELKDGNEECRLVLNQDTNINVINLGKCSSKELRDWKFFSITLFKSNEKATADIMMKDSLGIETKKNLGFPISKTVDFVNKDSFIVFNNNLNKEDIVYSSAFELANFNVLDYDITPEEIKSFSLIKPFNCDYTCADCKGVCLKCQGDKLPVDGYCSASFVALMSDYQKVASYTSIELRSKVTKRLDSDRYGLFLWFNSNNNIDNNFDITYVYYAYKSAETLIKFSIEKNKFVVYIGEKSFIAFDNRTIDRNHWYYVGATIKDKSLQIFLKDQNIIKDSKIFALETIPIRITEDALFTNGPSILDKNKEFFTGAYYDIRLYTNNVPNEDQINEQFSRLPCPKSCVECASDLTCTKCADGFDLTDGVCADSKLNQSVLLLPKESFFNNYFMTLSIPTTFAFNKYTVNFFFRKKIHSPPSPIYNILSFEGADGKTYPLIQETSGNNYNSTFSLLGQTGNPITFTHNFSNEIYNYFVFVIQVDIPSKTLSYNIFDGQEHLAIQVISQEIKKFIIGDANGKEMNFEIGFFKLYQVLVGKDEIIKLRTKAPLDCDPGCISCNYQTGLCDTCLSESGKAVKICNNVLRGYLTAHTYNAQNFDPKIAEQYSISIKNTFKKDLNSEEYSIMGFFRLLDIKIFSEYKNDKFQILRVSNRDDNITSPSTNLITLEISTLNGIAQYYFVYNDGDQIVRSVIKDLDVIDNSWMLIYATVNVNEKTLKYAIQPINSAKVYLNTLKYVNYPERLTEKATFTIFGIGIGLPKEYHIVNGNFFNIYIGVNLKWNIELFDKFRLSIKIPADPICPENCEKCLTNDRNIIECLMCKTGFDLENQKCFQSDSKYIILADQNTFAFLPPLTDINLPDSLSLFPKNTITFYVRRNYIPKVLNKENTIFKSGNVSIKMSSSLKGDASLLIGVENYPTSLTFNIDQNLEVDYDWYLVIINYSPNVLDVILKTESNEEKKGLILPENIKIVISTISFNSLIDELSIYAPNIIQRNFYNINFSKPSTFCELECVVCMDNKCRECYYGFDSNGLCNKIPIKFPDFSVINGSKFVNSFSLTDSLTSSQPLRSSSWSLLFTFELSSDLPSYSQNGLATLFRLANNNLGTSTDNSINDNLFTIMFSKNNTFLITFSNRYYYAQLRSPNGITTSAFKVNPINKNYFVGIIFDAQKNQIFLHIYNSVDCFIKETYSFKGKSENLNIKSSLIFAESFKTSVNSIIIEHVQFFYDTAISESKFNEYSAKHLINYQNTCLSNSRISCKQCSLKGNDLIEGVCSPVSNINSWLLNKIKSVSTLSPGLISDKKMYFTPNETQFTISFWYRRLNYSNEPHGILKLNLNDGNKVTQFINFRLLGGDLYVDLYNQTPTQVNGLKLSSLYSVANGLTWHYLSVSVDLNSNTIQLYDFDFNEKKNRFITSTQSKITTGIVLNNVKYMTLIAGFDTTVSNAGYNFQLSSFIYSSTWFPKDTSSYELYRVRIPRKCDMNCKTECDSNNLCPVTSQFNGAISAGDIYLNSPLLKGKTDIATVNSLKLFRYIADMVTSDFQGQPVWDHYLISFEIDVNSLLTSTYKSNKNILIDINNSPYPRNTNLTMNDIIPDDLVKFGAFAVEVTSEAIRFYIGSSISNKVINFYDFKTDNLKGISKIYMQVYVDSNSNFGRITAYIDDLRSFYDLKITFPPEPISLSTLVYNHPAVLNMRINVANPRFISDYYQSIYDKIQETSTYPSKICGTKCLKCTYIPNSTSLNCDKCLPDYYLVNGGCLKNNLQSK